MDGLLAETFSLDANSRFQKHLNRCPDCSAFFHTYKKTVMAMIELRTDGVPAPELILPVRFRPGGHC